MQKKFKSYEIVKVMNSSNPILNELVNKEGYIAGDIFNNEVGKWFYVVCIFDKGIAFHFSEDDLDTTGKYFREESLDVNVNCATILKNIKSTVPFLKLSNCSDTHYKKNKSDKQLLN